MADEELDPTKPYDPAALEDRLKRLSEDQRKTFWRMFTQKQRNLEAAEIAQRQALRKLYRDALDDIERQISDNFRDTDNWDLATMRRTGRQRFLYQQIVDRIRSLGGRVDEVAVQTTLDQFKQAYAFGAYQQESFGQDPQAIKFGLLPDRDIVSMLSQDFNGADFSTRLGLITDDMAHNIQTELTRSMIAEESWGQAARRIREWMGSGSGTAFWRANMIARTELRRASSLGGYQFAQENEDIIDRTVWLAHAGACPICIELDGDELEGPEDYPPFQSHPNCTCSHMDLPAGQEYEGFGKVSRSPEDFGAWAERNGIGDLVTA